MNILCTNNVIGKIQMENDKVTGYKTRVHL